MLVLLPVLLLFLFALAILVWSQFRPGISYLWLAAAGGSILAWGLVLGARWFNPDPFALPVWQTGLEAPFELAWELDEFSWPYAFALSSLLLAVLLTESARLQEPATPLLWVGSLAVNGAALLGVMANNPITMILAWTAIDLMEGWVVFANARSAQKIERVATAFIVRVFGTLMVIWSMSYSASRGAVLDFANIFPDSAIFLLIAVGLRMGVVPLHVPFTEELEVRRGLGTLIRFASPASSLVLLGHLPASIQLAGSTPLLLSLAAITTLYAAIMWASASDAISGRPFWLISMAAVAVSLVLNGSPQQSVIPGMTLVLLGGVLFLFTQRRQWMVYLPLAAGLSMAGLPFTPAAGLYETLAARPLSLANGLILLAYTVLIFGYFRHTRKMGREPEKLERWLVVVYPAGLLILILGFWALMLILPASFFTAGVWWAAAMGLGLAAGGVVLQERYGASLAQRSPWVVAVLQRAGRFSADILRMDWIYRIGDWAFRVIQQILQFGVTMLEGDGGVLWAVVLLVLLVSFLYRGGTP